MYFPNRTITRWKKKEKQLLIPSSVHVLRKNRSHAFLMSGRGFVFLDDEAPSSFHRQSNITTLPSSSSPQYRPFPPSTTPRDGTLFPDRNFSKLIFISILEKTQLIELNPTQTHTAGWLVAAAPCRRRRRLWSLGSIFSLTSRSSLPPPPPGMDDDDDVTRIRTPPVRRRTETRNKKLREK